MVRYGWIGALFAVALGISELALYLSSGVPIRFFPDMILTFTSIGVVTGVVSARVSADAGQPSESPHRERVLAETAWTERADSSPILSATIDALADVEGVESTELDPIYDYVEPSVFENLKTNESAPWQFTFHTDEYAIHISSYGTVAVSDHNPLWETEGS